MSKLKALLLRKDFLFSGLSFGLKFISNLVVFGLLARILEVSVFGVVSFLVLLVTIIQTIIDYGHRVFIVKELTQGEQKLDASYLAKKFHTKIFLFGLIALAFIPYAIHQSFWGVNPLLLFIFISSGFFMGIAYLGIAVFHSNNRFEYETIVLAVSVSTVLFGVFLTHYFSDEFYFLLFYFFSTLLMALTSLFLLRKKFGISIKALAQKVSFPAIKKEYLIAGPFAIITIVDIFYGTFDTFYIESYCTENELGIYQGIIKILVGLSVFSIITLSVCMPIVSRLYAEGSRQSLYKIIGMYVGLSVIGAIIFMLYFIFNREIILVVLGAKFIEIAEWDFQIGLYCMSRYFRIIPAIFLVISGNHFKRLSITFIVFLITLALFEYNIPSKGVKYAVKAISWSNMVLSLSYGLIFVYLIYAKFRKATH